MTAKERAENEYPDCGNGEGSVVRYFYSHSDCWKKSNNGFGWRYSDIQFSVPADFVFGKPAIEISAKEAMRLLAEIKGREVKITK